jgi:tRNA-modifying protein YgfZ
MGQQGRVRAGSSSRYEHALIQPAERDNGGMDFGSVVVADRSERGKLRFSGEQNAWFMHQVMTQAFEDIAPGEARDTAMLTAHGRMVGFMETIATEDAILAHFEPALQESFPDAIRRYVFATRVDIDDVSDEMGLVLVAGSGWESVVRTETSEAVIHSTASLGTPAAYLWTARSSVTELMSKLEAAGASRVDEQELEAHRIANGVPRWGYEMDEKTFPQEVGVDSRAVHYDKGCYVGQEAMAKIHLRGKVNRRLARVEGAALRRGDELTHDGTRVGVVTSASDGHALAVVKHTVAEGAELETSGSTARVVS